MASKFGWRDEFITMLKFAPDVLQWFLKPHVKSVIENLATLEELGINYLSQ